jgi:hypothetical protein
MNSNLEEIINLYFEKEVTSFQNNSIFLALQELVNNSKYILKCEKFCQEVKKTKYIYFSVLILNEKNEWIETDEGDVISAITLLIIRDKKNRYQFFSLDNDDFIDSLAYMIKDLNSLLK